MNPDKKVAFYTLGCKLNFSETSTIARNFINEGFKRVDFEEKADIIGAVIADEFGYVYSNVSLHSFFNSYVDYKV